MGKQKRMSKRSIHDLWRLSVNFIGYSFVWAVVFLVIKIVSSDIAYGEGGIRNHVAVTINAYAFEVMAGMWVCAVVIAFMYQWKKLTDALQNQEEESQRKKNEMLAYLAHDLRTPLTSVLGYAHILERMEQLETREAREYIKVIVDKSHLLEEMLDEFFEVTKLETGNVKLNRKTINLAEMLRQLVYEYTPILHERGISLVCNVISQADVACDASKMERVFDNLMRNVMKYAPANSNVKVTGTIQDNRFIICFDNESEAIEEGQLTAMFEPFVRMDEARKDVEGAGIGLAIVKEIMELHQGNTRAEYKEGRLYIILQIPMNCKE